MWLNSQMSIRCKTFILKNCYIIDVHLRLDSNIESKSYNKTYLNFIKYSINYLKNWRSSNQKFDKNNDFWKNSHFKLEIGIFKSIKNKKVILSAIVSDPTHPLSKMKLLIEKIISLSWLWTRVCSMTSKRAHHYAINSVK